MILLTDDFPRRWPCKRIYRRCHISILPHFRYSGPAQLIFPSVKNTIKYKHIILYNLITYKNNAQRSTGFQPWVQVCFRINPYFCRTCMQQLFNSYFTE